MPTPIVLETFAQLHSAEIEPPGWLWGEIIGRRSLTVIHAGTKRAKSMFTKNLALALAAGWPRFLDLAAHGPARTIIFQREVDRYWMQQRVRKMIAHAPEPITAEALGLVQHNFSRATRLRDPQVFREFRRMCIDQRPDHIVLDPFAHVVTDDEKDNAAVGQVLEPLLDLRDECGAAITVVHHDRKTSETTRGADPSESARGASRLLGDADTIISLARGSKHPLGPSSRFFVLSRNSEGVENFSAVFNRHTCWWERVHGKGDAERIAGWCDQAGSALTRDELIARIEAEWGLADPTHHRAALRYLEKAVEQGVLSESGKCYARAKKETA